MDSADHTIVQDASALSLAQELSLESQLQLSSEAPVLPGLILETLIGRGSFGEVWSGLQTGSGQKVAVKIFTEPAGLDWRYFKTEIKRLRQVAEHPHVVTLLDADLQQNPPYFCMTLYRESLAGWRKRVDRVEQDQVLTWFLEIAQALKFTHEKGLLHCDLKPANVLLDEELRARVADFGQAMERGLPGRAAGSLGFMAPEQASLEDSTPDVRWDIYGLGATIYFLLTGLPPRLSAQGRDTLGSIADPTERLEKYQEVVSKARLVPLGEAAVGVHPDLEHLVHSCLSLDPRDRPQSIGEVLEDLKRIEDGRPLLCLRPWSWSYRTQRYLRRNRWLVTACALLLMSLIVVVFTGYQRSEERRKALALQQFETGWGLAVEGKVAEAALWWARAYVTDRDNLASRAALDSVTVDLEGELRHGEFPLNTVAFDPTGEWLASADSGGEVRLWRDGKLEVELSGKREVLPDPFSVPTPQLAFTANGRLLITSGGLYEVGSAEPALRFEDEALFDGDGYGVLLVTSDGGLTSFNTTTMTEKPVQPWADSRPLRAAFSSSGTDFALVDDGGRAVLYREGRPAGSHFDDRVDFLRFSPDGVLLVTCSDDRTAKIWEVESGTLLYTLEHGWPVVGARFSNDGERLVTTTYNGSIFTWEVETGRLKIQAPVKHAWLSFGTSASADETLMASFGVDGKVRVWDVHSGEPSTPWFFHGSAVRSVALRPDGEQLVTAGHDGLLKFWKVQPERSYAELYPHARDEEILSVDWDPLGEMIVTSWQTFPLGGGARLWSVDGQPLADLEKTGAASILVARFSPSGDSILLRCDDGSVRLFTREGREQARLEHPARVSAARFSPSGTHIVTASTDGTLRVWTPSSNQVRQVETQAALVDARFSPDETLLVSADRAGLAEVRRVEDLETVTSHQHPAPLTWAVFDPQGQILLLCGEDGLAVLLRLDDQSMLALSHPLLVLGGEFDSTGQRVVTTCLDGTVRLWSTLDGSQLSSPIGHDGPVLVGKFSSDDRLILTVSKDGNAQLWEAETGRPFGLPIRHQKVCHDGVFSKDGNYVLTGSHDGLVRLTRVPLSEQTATPTPNEIESRMGIRFQEGEGLTVCESVPGESD